MNLILLLVGLGCLVLGAELLVRGAVALSQLAKISPLVIGLSVVAFGTSAPELTVSIMSSLKGNNELAIGNVVGSNIFNVMFILGLCACILPITVCAQLIRFNIPMMIAASIIAFLVAMDGVVSRLDGIGMFTAFVIYTVWLISAGRKDFDSTEAQEQAAGQIEASIQINRFGLLQNCLLVTLGLALLIVGGNLLVSSATVIARAFNVSDLVIGLTIVSAGTSLPELATSVIASLKGQRDIAIGGVVGSNVFNLLAVLGLSSIVSKTGLPVPPSVLRMDMVVMVGVAVVCWPICYSQLKISRLEGSLMLILYLVYVLTTILQ